MSQARYMSASAEAGKAFFARPMAAPFFMLNMLRFKAVADYSKFPSLDPGKPLSGAEAYQLYMRQVQAQFGEIGSQVTFFGQASPFLIGPEAEQWDAVLIVQHASKEAFLGFVNSPAYLKHAGHREAALADSRLLPMAALSFKDWPAAFD